MGVLSRLLDRIMGGGATQREEVLSTRVDFQKLQSILHYNISNQQLFIQALSHRSYIQYSDDHSAISNERLEFLGDAVLNLVVGEHLYRKYTDAPEGDLTKIRSRLVNRKAINSFARALHLEDFILMSQSASQVAEKGLDTILSDAYEAVIGAIYIDGGYTEAKKFIQHNILDALELGTVNIEDENYKSLLLEHTQAEGLGIPRYMTINQAGPEHDRTFTVEVFIGDSSYGVGSGKSKKDAEQHASAEALQRLKLN